MLCPLAGHESDKFGAARAEKIGDSPKQCSPIPRTPSRTVHTSPHGPYLPHSETRSKTPPLGANMHGRGPAESTSRRPESAAALSAHLRPAEFRLREPAHGPPAPRAAAAMLCVHRCLSLLPIVTV